MFRSLRLSPRSASSSPSRTARSPRHPRSPGGAGPARRPGRQGLLDSPPPPARSTAREGQIAPVGPQPPVALPRLEAVDVVPRVQAGAAAAPEDHSGLLDPQGYPATRAAFEDQPHQAHRDRQYAVRCGGAPEHARRRTALASWARATANGDRGPPPRPLGPPPRRAAGRSHPRPPGAYPPSPEPGRCVGDLSRQLAGVRAASPSSIRPLDERDDHALRIRFGRSGSATTARGTGVAD